MNSAQPPPSPPPNRPPTGPRGAAHWARMKGAQPETRGKRERTADLAGGNSDVGRTAKRSRVTAADSGVSERSLSQPRVSELENEARLSATIRDLQAKHVQAKLDHALALDQLAQLKQVVADLSRQLVEAKVNEFNSSTTREEVEAMLTNGMPSWIANELFTTTGSSAIEPGRRTPDRMPRDERGPQPRLPAAHATQLAYFMEGSTADEHLADNDPPPIDSSACGPLLSERDLMAMMEGVNYRRSINGILWQATQQYRLPAPVGKYGHPFCKGWLWEDFDVKRLFKRSGPDRVTPGSPQFERLAREAALIPFSCRSAIQRQVVSQALKERVLPVPGAQPEPNVLQFCKENPALLPYAIRRHYTCDHDKGFIFAEWDAVDLEIYIVLKMAAPPKASDPSLRRHQHARWMTALAYALHWATSNTTEWWTGSLPDEYPDGARPYEGRLDDYDGIVTHLQRCGFYYEMLLGGPCGYVYNYVQRMIASEARKQELNEEYERKRTGADKSTQRDVRDYVSRNMLYEGVPTGDPVVRVKLSSNKLKGLLEQPDKVVQYTVY